MAVAFLAAAIERTRVRMAIRTCAYWVTQTGDIAAGHAVNRLRRGRDRIRRLDQRRRDEFAADVAALPGVTSVRWNANDSLHVEAVLPSTTEVVVVGGTFDPGDVSSH